MERDLNGNMIIVQRDITELMKLPDLSSFKTRADFNAWKTEQAKITSGKNPHYNIKKNQYGFAVSEYALTVAENKLYKAQLNQRIEREKFGNIPVARTGMTVAERQKMMKRPDKTGFNKLKFNFNDVMDSRHFEGRLKSLTERSDPNEYDRRKRQMKENWTKMILEVFGGDAQDLVDFVNRLSDDEFYALYLHEEEEEIMVFDLFYNTDLEVDPNGYGQMEKIRHYFEQYANGMLEVKPERVNDLKGF